MYLVFALRWAQTGLVIVDGVSYFATGFGASDASNMDRLRREWLSVPTLTGISTLLCSLLPARRGLDVAMSKMRQSLCWSRRLTLFQFLVAGIIQMLYAWCQRLIPGPMKLDWSLWNLS